MSSPRLSRRTLLGAAGAAPAVAQTAATTRRPDNQPNILLVITDDLRYDSLGCTGHTFARKPAAFRFHARARLLRLRIPAASHELVCG